MTRRLTRYLKGSTSAGKLALVTGGSSGLGAETARALASKGAQLVITARNLAKVEEVAGGIRASTGSEAVDVMELELGSFASIRAFAGEFLAEGIYAAATDGKTQLRYLIGEDAEQTYAMRQQVGDDAFVAGVRQRMWS